MTHRQTTRPVSGKLMASAAPPAGTMAPFPVNDVIDAEFETVGRQRPRPIRADDGALAFRPGLETLGREPARRPAQAASGGRLFWGVGACLIFAAFWVSGGHSALLGADASGAAVVHSAALTLSGVSSRVDHSGARPVILVDGNAGNDGTRSVDLPGLEISVADLEGKIIRYRLGTAVRRLAPGEQFAFSSRLDVPKSGVKTVSVSFAR